ncbi:MAG: hypothetical protein KC586_19030 [Myxococcales bacterium]|nr:hypothetical protein [Myxococcales bacterium]
MRLACTLSVAEQDTLARRAAEGDADAERTWLEAHRGGVSSVATRMGLDPTRELVNEALDALRRHARDPEHGFDVRRGYVLGLWGFGHVRRLLEAKLAHDARCAEVARAGELDALVALEPASRALYRWLHVALDLGHDDADDLLGDLEEQSDLRFDDAGSERRAAHWRVALDFLGGRHGLPRDLAHAGHHLDEAFSFRPGHEVLAELEVANLEHHDVDAARAGLDEEALRLLDDALAGAPVRLVSYLLERVERLLELRAPQVVVDGEGARLAEAAAEVALDAELAARVAAFLTKP